MSHPAGAGLPDRRRRDTVLLLTSLDAGLTQLGVAAVLLTRQHPALPLAAAGGAFQELTTPALRGIVSDLAAGSSSTLAAGSGLQRASSLLATAAHLGCR